MSRDKQTQPMTDEGVLGGGKTETAGRRKWENKGGRERNKHKTNIKKRTKERTLGEREREQKETVYERERERERETERERRHEMCSLFSPFIYVLLFL